MSDKTLEEVRSEALASGTRLPTLDDLVGAEVLGALEDDERTVLLTLFQKYGEGEPTALTVRLTPFWRAALDVHIVRIGNAGSAAKRATWCQEVIQRALYEALTGAAAEDDG